MRTGSVLSIYLHRRSKITRLHRVNAIEITYADFESNFLAPKYKSNVHKPKVIQKRGKDDLITELAEPANHGWDYEE